MVLAWDLNGHQFSVLLLLCYENGLFMLLSGFSYKHGFSSSLCGQSYFDSYRIRLSNSRWSALLALGFLYRPILLEHVTGDQALGYRMDCLQNSITLQLPWELAYSLLVVQLFWHWSHTHVPFESQTFYVGSRLLLFPFPFSFFLPVCGCRFVGIFAPFILHDFIHMIEPL